MNPSNCGVDSTKNCISQSLSRMSWCVCYLRPKKAMKGATSAIHTADAAMLKSGIFMDAMYMNKKFIKDHRKTAVAVLKARWEGLGYWHDHVEETNKLMAKYLKWSEEDIGFVIGTNGKSFEGGIYMYDFDESARMCGVLDGDPPFGLKNNAMTEVAALTNRWWIKLGLMKNTIDPAKAIDCSLMADLVKSGYRQALSAM